MKKVLVPIIILVAAALAYGAWAFLTQDWRGNDLPRFVNEDQGYAFRFPEGWHVMGENDVVTFYNTETPPGDGGIPAGIRVDVMALENYDSLPLEDWVDEMEQNGPGEHVVSRENLTIASVPAIRKSAISPFAPDDSTPPTISVTFAKDNSIFLINYLGSEPSYSEEMPGFESLLKSFHFE